VGRQAAGLAPVAQGQGVAQQLADLAGEVSRRASGGFQEFAASSHQVGQALLVAGQGKAVIGRPAVVDQQAGVAAADEAFGDLVSAPAGHVVDRGHSGDEAVHPGGPAADPPAGLVGHDPGGRQQRVGDTLVDRIAALRGAQENLAHARARQPDAEQRAEVLGDLAVTQAGVFVQVDDGGLGVGAELTGGRPQGVGGL